MPRARRQIIDIDWEALEKGATGHVTVEQYVPGYPALPHSLRAKRPNKPSRPFNTLAPLQVLPLFDLQKVPDDSFRLLDIPYSVIGDAPTPIIIEAEPIKAPIPNYIEVTDEPARVN